MTKSEGTGGKLVENGGIAPVVIPLVVAITLKSQLVKIDGIPAQNARQKFIPRDVLLDGRHNSSGFLNIYNQKKNHPCFYAYLLPQYNQQSKLHLNLNLAVCVPGKAFHQTIED